MHFETYTASSKQHTANPRIEALASALSPTRRPDTARRQHWRKFEFERLPEWYRLSVPFTCAAASPVMMITATNRVGGQQRAARCR